MKKYFWIACVFSFLFYPALGAHISPSDFRIQTEGVCYAHSVQKGIEFLRFSEELLRLDGNVLQADSKKARTTSGVSLVFRMEAPEATVGFFKEVIDGGRDSDFAVYADGCFQKNFYFPETQEQQPVSVTNPNPGQPVTIRIVLPSWSNPLFTGIDLPGDEELLDQTPSQRKTYIAIGDSITHGTGQGSAAYKTYPWLLAEKLEYELFNLAVGGSKISLPIVQAVKDWEHVDLFTVLIGYNDWNAGESAENYRKNLDQLIGTLRKYHPETPLFVIRQTFTKSEAPRTGSVAIEEFRNAVSSVVAQRKNVGDQHIFVTDGDALTNESDLNDAVHLNPAGAAKFADRLYQIIKQKL